MGAKGGLTPRGCVWQDCLPAGRSHCPLWSRWPQPPIMTYYVACERAGQLSWPAGLDCVPQSWELERAQYQLPSAYLPAQKGGRAGFSHAGKCHYEQ